LNAFPLKSYNNKLDRDKTEAYLQILYNFILYNHSLQSNCKCMTSHFMAISLRNRWLLFLLPVFWFLLPSKELNQHRMLCSVSRNIRNSENVDSIIKGDIWLETKQKWAKRANYPRSYDNRTFFSEMDGKHIAFGSNRYGNDDYFHYAFKLVINKNA